MGNFEKEIVAILEDLDSERSAASQSLVQAQESLAAIEEKRTAVNRTLNLYREMNGLPPKPLSVDHTLRDQFEGKTAKEVLIEIANERDGRLVAKEAVAVMVRAGMFINKSSASARFYNTVGRHPDLFKWVDRGVYRLADEERELPPPWLRKNSSAEDTKIPVEAT